MTERRFFVYILASRSRVLYTGVTNDLGRRVTEHRQRSPRAFTTRYQVHRLVYYEVHASAAAAIEREKQIKGWRRAKRVRLIESVNPEWGDLAGEWIGA
jgi:putative endonuclease